MYRIQNCNSLFEFDNKIRPYLLRLTKWKSSGERFFLRARKNFFYTYSGPSYYLVKMATFIYFVCVKDFQSITCWQK